MEEIKAESLLYEASFTNIDKYQFFYLYISSDYLLLFIMIIVIIWSVLSFKFIDGLVLTVYCVKRYAYKNTLECLYKWKRYISRDFAKRRD